MRAQILIYPYVTIILQLASCNIFCPPLIEFTPPPSKKPVPLPTYFVFLNELKTIQRFIASFCDYT